MGLPFPSPEDLPSPGIELGSPALHADFSPSATGKISLKKDLKERSEIDFSLMSREAQFASIIG